MWHPVAAPGAPIGAADSTRRWALAGPGGAAFPGLTRPEAEGYAPALGARDDAGDLLARVALDALLTGGAGPHVLTADGSLGMVLGPHPHVAGAHVCMAEAPGADRVVGAVEDLGDGLWRWLARRRVTRAAHVEALDAVAGAGDAAALGAWSGPPGPSADRGRNA